MLGRGGCYIGRYILLCNIIDGETTRKMGWHKDTIVTRKADEKEEKEPTNNRGMGRLRCLQRESRLTEKMGSMELVRGEAFPSTCA